PGGGPVQGAQRAADPGVGGDRVRAAGGGAAQHQGADPVRVVGGEPLRHLAAHRRAVDVRALHPQVVQDRGDVGGEPGDGVLRLAGRATGAGAPVVRRDGAEGGVEVAPDPVPPAVVVGLPAEQDQRLPAPADVVEDLGLIGSGRVRHPRILSARSVPETAGKGGQPAPMKASISAAIRGRSGENQSRWPSAELSSRRASPRAAASASACANGTAPSLREATTSDGWATRAAFPPPFSSARRSMRKPCPDRIRQNSPVSAARCARGSRSTTSAAGSVDRPSIMERSPATGLARSIPRTLAQVAASTLGANASRPIRRTAGSGQGSGPTADTSTSLRTRSGWRAARATAVGPPADTPTAAATR